MYGLYNDIGKKIKDLAVIMFVLSTFAAVVLGIMALTDSEAWYGIMIIIFGPLIAFVESCLIYGFGELIDKICDIEVNTRGKSKKSSTQAKIDADRISQLEALRSQGLITEEEYQKLFPKSDK